MKNCVVLGGSSHPELVERICKNLDIEPLKVEAKTFANGETSVNITESVRDKQVYVIQSASGGANDSLMELLIMISACKTASAKSVTAVLPLFPYSRQPDIRDTLRAPTEEMVESNVPVMPPRFELAPAGSPVRPGANASPVRPAFSRQGTPFHVTRTGSATEGTTPTKEIDLQFNSGYKYWIAQSGALVALLLSQAGADHIITLDLHDPQFQGFFDIPVDNLYGRPLIEQYIMTQVPNYREAVIVSPDAGGAKRATAIADHLGLRFALIHKDRRNNATILVGNVSDRVAIIIDDLIDTGRTIIRAAKIIKDNGAQQIYAICTHGLFSGNAAQQLKKSHIDKVVVTNSVPLQIQGVLGDRFQVLDISMVFAEAIRRIHNGESISMLFDHTVGVV